jgi:hypothetical protein
VSFTSLAFSSERSLWLENQPQQGMDGQGLESPGTAAGFTVGARLPPVKPGEDAPGRMSAAALPPAQDIGEPEPPPGLPEGLPPGQEPEPEAATPTFSADGATAARSYVEQELKRSGRQLAGEEVIDVLPTVVMRGMSGMVHLGCLALTTYRVVFMPSSGDGRQWAGGLLALMLCAVDDVDVQMAVPTCAGLIHAANIRLRVKDTRALHFFLDRSLYEQVAQQTKSSRLDRYAQLAPPAAPKSKMSRVFGRKHVASAEPAEALSQDQERLSQWCSQLASQQLRQGCQGPQDVHSPYLRRPRSKLDEDGLGFFVRLPGRVSRVRMRASACSAALTSGMCPAPGHAQGNAAHGCGQRMFAVEVHGA